MEEEEEDTLDLVLPTCIVFFTARETTGENNDVSIGESKGEAKEEGGGRTPFHRGGKTEA